MIKIIKLAENFVNWTIIIDKIMNNKVVVGKEEIENRGKERP